MVFDGSAGIGATSGVPAETGAPASALAGGVDRCGAAQARTGRWRGAIGAAGAGAAMIGRDGGDGTSRGGRLAGPAAHAQSASAATVAAMRCAMACERTAGTGIDIGERVRMGADTDGKDLAGGGGSPAYRAEAGTLYVVATPLGNLRDVTLRALDILGTADVVAAEDTRMTARLLGHYGVVDEDGLAARAQRVAARAVAHRACCGTAAAWRS